MFSHNRNYVIVKSTFTKCDAQYRPMYKANYSFNHHRGLDIGQIADAVTDATMHGTLLSSSAFAPVATTVFGIDPTVDRQRDVVNIVNGWGEERYSFIITILCNAHENGQRRLVTFSGYTSHAGIPARPHLHSSEIDQSMVLYINNCHITRETDVLDQYQNRRTRVNSHTQKILRGNRGSVASTNWGRPDHDVFLRPVDIFYANSSTGILSNTMGNDRYVDGRVRPGGEIQTSNILDNNPTDYLASIIATGVHSHRMASEAEAAANYNEEGERPGMQGFHRRVGGSNNPMDLAIGHLRNDTFIEKEQLFNDFINNTDFAKDGEITFGDLCDICAIDEDNFVVYGQMDSLVNCDDSNWYGAHTEAIIARLLSAALVSLATQCQIVQCAVNIHNNTPTGKPEVLVTPIAMYNDSLTDIQVEQYASNMVFRIETEVCPMILAGNDFDYAVSATIREPHEFQVSVSINGSHPEQFTRPAWIDSANSPTISTRPEVLDEMAFNFGEIISHIASY